MKVIINTINFYSNVVIINHGQYSKTIINPNNNRNDQMSENDLSELTPCTIIDDNNEHPLIAQLEGRILQVENEKQELLDQLDNASK